MSQSQFQVTGDADRALTSATRLLAPGQLRAVTTTILATGSRPAQNYIRLLIEQQNVDVPTWRHLILQGYIGFESGLSWTGNYPIDKDAQITIELMSSTLATVIVSITTEPN